MSTDEIAARIGALAPRFMSKVLATPSSGCWLWTACIGKNGYGQIRIKGVLHLAHRLAWQAVNGQIPSGLEIDHFACDTRSCVNPAHLRPVTRRENILRGNGTAAWNLAKTHCKFGHEFTDGNTFNMARHKGAGRRERVCKECRRVKARAAYWQTRS